MDPNQQQNVVTSPNSPVTTPPTISSIQALMAQNRQDLGQRTAALPQTADNLRSGIFNNDQTLNTLRQNQQQKIMELYQHDKDLATQYANPQSNLYLKDPYQREQARATQYGGTMNELSSLGTQISGRQNVLGDYLNRALQLAQMGIQGDTAQNQMLAQELQTAIAAQQAPGNMDALLSIPELQALNFGNANPLPYGTTRGQAAQAKITPSGMSKLSAANLGKLRAWQAANSQLQDVQTTFNTHHGISGTIPGALTNAAEGGFGTNILGGLGGILPAIGKYIATPFADQNAIGLDAKLATLTNSVMQALAHSGVSASAQDIRNRYIPSIGDSPEVFSQKLTAAQSLIDSQMTSLSGNPGSFDATAGYSSSPNISPLSGINGLQPPSYFTPDMGGGQ